jgi:hypothetical protein
VDVEKLGDNLGRGAESGEISGVVQQNYLEAGQIVCVFEMVR